MADIQIAASCWFPHRTSFGNHGVAPAESPDELPASSEWWPCRSCLLRPARPTHLLHQLKSPFIHSKICKGQNTICIQNTDQFHIFEIEAFTTIWVPTRMSIFLLKQLNELVVHYVYPHRCQYPFWLLWLWEKSPAKILQFVRCRDFFCTKSWLPQRAQVCIGG